MKTILVTGSTGFLGSNLVAALAKEKRYHVIAAVRDPNRITINRCNEYLQIIANDELLKGNVPETDIAVNCAFARSNDAFLLADALDFTGKLANAFQTIGVGSLINVSSQGVYKRLPNHELQTEDTEIEPIDMYSMAKYAAEKLLVVSKCASSITNVRLASVNMKQRFLFAFVKKILEGEQIILTAPHMNAALIDVQDAVSGLQALINMSDADRKEIYNLGTGTQMTVLGYAQIAVDTLKAYGYMGEIVLHDTDMKAKNSGMDCSNIMRDTGWVPKVTIKDMVQAYYAELIQER